MKQCHGCDGKGWITVGIDYPEPSRKLDFVNPYVPWYPCPHYTEPCKPYPSEWDYEWEEVGTPYITVTPNTTGGITYT